MFVKSIWTRDTEDILLPTLKDFLYSQHNDDDAEMEHASFLVSNMNHKQQLVAMMCSHPQHMEQRWTLKQQHSNEWKYIYISKLHVTQLVWQYLKIGHSTSTHHKSGASSQAMTELTNVMDNEPAATI